MPRKPQAGSRYRELVRTSSCKWVRPQSKFIYKAAGSIRRIGTTCFCFYVAFVSAFVDDLVSGYSLCFEGDGTSVPPSLFCCWCGFSHGGNARFAKSSFAVEDPVVFVRTSVIPCIKDNF